MHHTPHYPNNRIAMNKLESRIKGLHKYKKRLSNYGLKSGNYALKTTGKPCSCAMCSPKNIVFQPKKYYLREAANTNL